MCALFFILKGVILKTGPLAFVMAALPEQISVHYHLSSEPFGKARVVRFPSLLRQGLRDGLWVPMRLPDFSLPQCHTSTPFHRSLVGTTILGTISIALTYTHPVVVAFHHWCSLLNRSLAFKSSSSNSKLENAAEGEEWGSGMSPAVS